MCGSDNSAITTIFQWSDSDLLGLCDNVVEQHFVTIGPCYNIYFGVANSWEAADEP